MTRYKTAGAPVRHCRYIYIYLVVLPQIAQACPHLAGVLVLARVEGTAGAFIPILIFGVDLRISKMSVWGAGQHPYLSINRSTAAMSMKYNNNNIIKAR
jgi:hypothetical protein